MPANVPVLPDAPTIVEARDYVRWMVASEWGYSLGMDSPLNLGFPVNVADALVKNESELFKAFPADVLSEIFWEMVDLECDGRA